MRMFFTLALRMMHPMTYHFIFLLFFSCFISQASAEVFSVKGLLIESIAQVEDDEEAPFEIRAVNKRHKCGGKSSNLFRIYSEYELVGERRFNMAMNAMEHGYNLSLTTKGCEGNALVAHKIRISR